MPHDRSLTPEVDCADVSTGCWVSNALSEEHLSRNKSFEGFFQRRRIDSYLYTFPKDAALLSEKTSITHTVLTIKGEHTTKWN